MEKLGSRLLILSNTHKVNLTSFCQRPSTTRPVPAEGHIARATRYSALGHERETILSQPGIRVGLQKTVQLSIAPLCAYMCNPTDVRPTLTTQLRTVCWRSTSLRCLNPSGATMHRHVGAPRCLSKTGRAWIPCREEISSPLREQPRPSPECPCAMGSPTLHAKWTGNHLESPSVPCTRARTHPSAAGSRLLLRRRLRLCFRRRPWRHFYQGRASPV